LRGIQQQNKTKINKVWWAKIQLELSMHRKKYNKVSQQCTWTFCLNSQAAVAACSRHDDVTRRRRWRPHRAATAIETQAKNAAPCIFNNGSREGRPGRLNLKKR
jgi:hypothetical protein